MLTEKLGFLQESQFFASIHRFDNQRVPTLDLFARISVAFDSSWGQPPKLTVQNKLL